MTTNTNTITDTTSTRTELSFDTTGDGWVAYRSDKAEELAQSLTRGCYQEDVARGLEAWSGSTLKGKAGEYRGRYASSRMSWAHRCMKAGLRLELVRVDRRHVLVVG